MKCYPNMHALPRSETRIPTYTDTHKYCPLAHMGKWQFGYLNQIRFTSVALELRCVKQ